MIDLCAPEEDGDIWRWEKLYSHSYPPPRWRRLLQTPAWGDWMVDKHVHRRKFLLGLQTEAGE